MRILMHTAAIFLQRAYWRYTRSRRERIFAMRDEAAKLIQSAWYRFHGIIFSHLVLGIVKNKREAVVNKSNWVAQCESRAYKKVYHHHEIPVMIGIRDRQKI